LEDRLRKANDIIVDLTKKLKASESVDCVGLNLNILLSRIREQMMHEFMKYKKVRRRSLVHAGRRSLGCCVQEGRRSLEHEGRRSLGGYLQQGRKSLGCCV